MGVLYYVCGPSVAKEETIRSYELGFKSLLADNRLRLNGSAFYWKMQDQQLSAVGGVGNLIQLINADKTRGFGFEADMEWLLSENFSLIAGFAWNDTQIDDANLFVAPCGSGQCTPLDPIDSRGLADINNNSLPQAPDLVFNFNAAYRTAMGEGEMILSADMFIEGEKSLFLYESAEYRTSGDAEAGLRAAYQWEEGQYEVALFGRNIFDADLVKGGIDFNNNTAFVNEPRRFGVSFRANF